MNPNSDSLLSQAFDLTVQGIILAGVSASVYRHINGEGVVVICCYLALVSIWRLVFPLRRFNSYFAGQVISLALVATFSWWLIYTAENTRTGWYRFNVLQKRVSQFVRNSPAYIIIADADDYIAEASDNIHLLTGYTREELIGQPTTILMRDGPAAKHLVASEKVVRALRRNHAPDSGWTLQGTLTVCVKHKDGHIVPVRIYAGGIRWSTDIQFTNDIDIFAVFIPVSEATAREEVKSLETDHREIRVAPPAPRVRPIAPLPASRPLAPPQNRPIIRN